MKKQYNSLAIDISDKCNLNCAYCFEARGDNKNFFSINPSALYKGIDFFLSNMTPEKIGNLHFHFGRREPLMNFPLLRNVIHYIGKKGKERYFQPHFHLTTNGTCFSGEINGFLREHDFDIRVSLDGFSEVHDKNRRHKNNAGSFDQIIVGLNALKQEGIRFTLNSVYYPGTSFHQVYKLFNATGADRVDFFPLWIHDSKARGYFEPSDVQRMKKEMEGLVNDQIERILNKGLYRLTRIVQIENYLQYLCGYKRSPFYCGAGRNYIGISGNGHFYPCLKFINTPGWGVGDYSLGIDSENLSHYFRKAAPEISEMTVCWNCSTRDACKGLCYVDRLGLTDYRQSMSFYCSFQKSVFKAAKALYDALKETRPEAIVTLAGLKDAVSYI